MKRKHVIAIIGAKADTAAAVNNLLKKLRGLMKFAIEAKWQQIARDSINQTRSMA
jgi:hypothetical protein